MIKNIIYFHICCINTWREIYKKLDDWIKDKNFEFIYIGREFNELKNSTVIDKANLKRKFFAVFFNPPNILEP